MIALVTITSITIISVSVAGAGNVVETSGTTGEYFRIWLRHIYFINNYLTYQHIQGHRPHQFASCPVV